MITERFNTLAGALDTARGENSRLYRQLISVQVKTSTVFRNGRYEVTLATRGGNQSWNGLVKNFCCTRCDYLFVHAGDGRRWFIPSASVDGATGILLGGPKYAEFEVEPGETLQAMAAPRIARLADPRRGSRAVKGAWL